MSRRLSLIRSEIVDDIKARYRTLFFPLQGRIVDDIKARYRTLFFPLQGRGGQPAPIRPSPFLPTAVVYPGRTGAVKREVGAGSPLQCVERDATRTRGQSA